MCWSNWHKITGHDVSGALGDYGMKEVFRRRVWNSDKPLVVWMDVAQHKELLIGTAFRIGVDLVDLLEIVLLCTMHTQTNEGGILSALSVDRKWKKLAWKSRSSPAGFQVQCRQLGAFVALWLRYKAGTVCAMMNRHRCKSQASSCTRFYSLFESNERLLGRLRLSGQKCCLFEQSWPLTVLTTSSRRYTTKKALICGPDLKLSTWQ